MSEKVQRIKASIEAGTYKVDIETTAEKILLLDSLNMF